MSNQLLVHSSRTKYVPRIVRLDKSGATVDSADLLLGIRRFRHRTAHYEESDQVGIAQVRVGGVHGVVYVIVGVSVLTSRGCTIGPDALPGDLIERTGGQRVLRMPDGREIKLGAFDSGKPVEFSIEFMVPNSDYLHGQVKPILTTQPSLDELKAFFGSTEIKITRDFDTSTPSRTSVARAAPESARRAPAPIDETDGVMGIASSDFMDSDSDEDAAEPVHLASRRAPGVREFRSMSPESSQQPANRPLSPEHRIERGEPARRAPSMPARAAEAYTGVTRIMTSQSAPEYYLQPGTVYSMVSPNLQPAIGRVLDGRVRLEREVFRVAVRRVTSTTAAHSALAHLPNRWLTSYIDRVEHPPGSQSRPECASCIRLDLPAPPEVRAPAPPANPGSFWSTCIIEHLDRAYAAAFADETTGFIILQESIGGTLGDRVRTLEGQLELLPGTRAELRVVRLDYRDEAGAAPNLNIGMLREQDVPPFVRLGNETYHLKRYLETRLSLMVRAASAGADQVTAALNYLVHQHNQTQFGERASPHLSFTGVIDDRVWYEFLQPVEAFIDGAWTAATFAGWTTTGFAYEVFVGDALVSNITQIRLPSN